jgi:hypothetical protein
MLFLRFCEGGDIWIGWMQRQVGGFPLGCKWSLDNSLVVSDDGESTSGGGPLQISNTLLHESFLFSNAEGKDVNNIG